MIGRREFLGGAAAFAASVPATGLSAGGGGFVWGYMPQFGNNMWGDIMTPPTRDGIQTRILTDEEFAAICSPGYDTRTAVRFDETLWRSLSRKIRDDGSNLLLIDLGEFVVYPSHPELSVAGSWSAEIAIPWQAVGGCPSAKSSRKFMLGRCDSAGEEKSGVIYDV